MPGNHDRRLTTARFGEIKAAKQVPGALRCRMARATKPDSAGMISAAALVATGAWAANADESNSYTLFIPAERKES